MNALDVVPERRTIALLDRESDARPKHVELDWEGQKQLLTTDHIRTETKKGSPAWSPAHFTPPERSKVNARTVAVAVYDIDNATPAERDALFTWLDTSSYQAIVHSTFSHSEDNPKFRLILNLSRLVLNSEWLTVWSTIPRMLGLKIDTDPSCCDPSRLYYLPCAKPGAPTFAAANDGTLAIDVDAVLDYAAKHNTPALYSVPNPPPSAPITEQPTDDAALDVESILKGGRFVAVDGTVNMTAVRNALGGLKTQLVQRVLKGQRLAEAHGDDGGPGRDSAITSVCWTIAKKLPLCVPKEAILALLSESLRLMEPPGPDDVDWFALADRQIDEARADKAKELAAEAAKDHAAFEARHNRHKGAPTTILGDHALLQGSTQPLTPIAFVLSEGRFVCFSDGKWDLQNSVAKNLGAWCIDQYLPKALEGVAVGSEDYVKLRDLSSPLTHELVTIVRGVVFEPGKPPIFKDTDRMMLNLYVEPPDAVEGDCSLILAEIEYLTSNTDGTPDPEGYEYVLDWCARKVQFPGEPARNALVFDGPEGSGKTGFTSALKYVLGWDNCHDASSGEMRADFNSSYVSNNLLCVADDVDTSTIGEEFKTQITNKTIRKHPKGVDASTLVNRVGYILLTNTNRLKIVKDERRWSVFSNRKAVDEKRKAALARFYKSEGSSEPSDLFIQQILAFRWLLLNRKVDFKKIGFPYKNAARDAQIVVGRSVEAAFKAEVEDKGFCALTLELCDFLTAKSRHPEKTKFEKIVSDSLKSKSEKIPVGSVPAHDVFMVFQVWSEREGGKKTEITSTTLGVCLKGAPNPWPSFKSGSIYYSISEVSK